MLKIGTVYRMPKEHQPERAIVDGLPNYYFETNTPEYGFDFQKGIHKAKEVEINKIEKRCPLIIISSTPRKAGSEDTPWHDRYVPDHGYVKYYGDNKYGSGKPEEAPGNKKLLSLLNYHLNICILLIHHMRKAKDDNPFNMMTGSTGIGGATDGNFALKEIKCGSGKAIMYCQGRDIESTELRMHFDTDVMRWIVENEPAAQKSRDNIVLSAVYLFIRERIHFEGTATELVEELKSVTDEVIYPNRVTRDLVQNGYELSKYGIEFRYERVHKGRVIILHYNGERDSSDGRNVTVTQALPDSSQTSI